MKLQVAPKTCLFACIINKIKMCECQRNTIRPEMFMESVVPLKIMSNVLEFYFGLTLS